MHVLIVDPKLRSLSGHRFHADQAVAQECRARGHEVSVLADRHVTQAVRDLLGARGLFDVGDYPHDRDPGSRDFAAEFEELNARVEAALAGKPHPDLGADDLVFVPNAQSVFLDGIRRWYENLPEPRPRLRVRLLFPSWFRVPERDREIAIELDRRQMRALAALPADRVALLAESSALARYYEEMSGARVTVVPMPLHYADAPCGADRDPSDGLHLVFPGEARLEKGFQFLAHAFARARVRHPGIRLTAQASPLRGIGQDEVRRLAAIGPEVQVITETLTSKAYDRLVASADMVLAVYDPHAYALRASQVFLEAVGLGKPVLTTSGTWMHEQALALGLSPICAEAYTADAFAAALDCMLAAWDDARDKALKAAPISRARHSAAGLVDAVLGAG